MHNGSLKTFDSRILTMPGRSTSGVHLSGRHREYQARSAAGCSSHMEGELHPTININKKHLRGGLSHLMCTFLHTG